MHTTQGCSLIYRASTRPSAHDSSVTEKFSLLASHRSCAAHAVSITRSATPPMPHHLSVTPPHAAPPRPQHDSNSYCPSVTLVYYIHTAEDIVKLLCWPGSPITEAPIPNSKGKPFSGGAKYKGGKILRFSTEIAVYLGNGRDSIVTYSMILTHP